MAHLTGLGQPFQYPQGNQYAGDDHSWSGDDHFVQQGPPSNQQYQGYYNNNNNAQDNQHFVLADDDLFVQQGQSNIQQYQGYDDGEPGKKTITEIVDGCIEEWRRLTRYAQRSVDSDKDTAFNAGTDKAIELIRGYLPSENGCVSTFFHRIWNIFLAIFGCSAWQRAAAILRNLNEVEFVEKKKIEVAQWVANIERDVKALENGEEARKRELPAEKAYSTAISQINVDGLARDYRNTLSTVVELQLQRLTTFCEGSLVCAKNGEHSPELQPYRSKIDKLDTRLEELADVKETFENALNGKRDEANHARMDARNLLGLGWV